MTSDNGNGNGNHARYAPEDSLSSTSYGAAARCVARVVTCATDACDDAGIPLSELQRVTIVETALLEFDGFAAHLASLAAVDRLLRDLRVG
jgi:hypothetical protein